MNATGVILSDITHSLLLLMSATVTILTSPSPRIVDLSNRSLLFFWEGKSYKQGKVWQKLIQINHYS